MFAIIVVNVGIGLSNVTQESGMTRETIGADHVVYIFIKHLFFRKTTLNIF